LVKIVLALAGADFIGVLSTETFIPGSMDGDMKCVDITILDDDALEGDQIFTVTLTTSDPAVLLVNDELTVTIRDDADG